MLDIHVAETTDTCQNKVSADQYNVTISWAQILKLIEVTCFFEFDRCPGTGFAIGLQAEARLLIVIRAEVVRKLVNANPRH